MAWSYLPREQKTSQNYKSNYPRDLNELIIDVPWKGSVQNLACKLALQIPIFSFLPLTDANIFNSQ